MRKTYRFDEVFNLEMGKTPSRDYKDYWESGEFAWVSIRDLNQGKYVIETKEKISKKAVAETGIKCVKANTVLMSFKLSIGKVSIAKRELYTNEAIMAFNTKAHFDITPDFLYYYLQGFDWGLGNRAVMGVTLNKSSLSAYKITIPTVEDQARIISELDSLNDIITKKKQQLEALDKLAQATFYEMFGEGNNKKWEATKLSEVTEFLTSGSRGWSSYFSDKGSLFLTIKNVRGGKIDLSKVQYVNAPDNQEAIRTKVQEGDLLISITADLGRTAVIDKSISNFGAYINQHLSIIRLNKSVLNPMFVSYYLESEAGKAQFVNKSQVGVKSGLNFSAINSLEIILPPKELQDVFARSIDSVESQKALLHQSLTDTQQLFDYTMNKYFGS